MTWEIDCDTSVWLQVPALGDDTEAEEWLDRASEAICADFRQDWELAGDYPVLLRTQLSILVDTAREQDDGAVLMANLPTPNDNPYPVLVSFREPEQDSPDYLLDVAGANLPAVEPPVVEHVSTDHLGEGIVVRRYADDELGLVANVCWAWRAHDNDVFVFVQTNDLGRLEQVMPDIETLIEGIRPAAEADGT